MPLTVPVQVDAGRDVQIVCDHRTRATRVAVDETRNQRVDQLEFQRQSAVGVFQHKRGTLAVVCRRRRRRRRRRRGMELVHLKLHARWTAYFADDQHLVVQHVCACVEPHFQPLVFVGLQWQKPAVCRVSCKPLRPNVKFGRINVRSQECGRSPIAITRFAATTAATAAYTATAATATFRVITAGIAIRFRRHSGLRGAKQRIQFH